MIITTASIIKNGVTESYRFTYIRQFKHQYNGNHNRQISNDDKHRNNAMLNTARSVYQFFPGRRWRKNLGTPFPFFLLACRAETHQKHGPALTPKPKCRETLWNESCIYLHGIYQAGHQPSLKHADDIGSIVETSIPDTLMPQTRITYRETVLRNML